MTRPYILYPNGQRPSIELTRTEEAIDNPIYFFKTEIDWQKSALRQLILKMLTDLITEGDLVKEDVEENGFFVSFEELTDQTLLSLGITERNEIDGIGVFTIDMLLGERPRTFYKSHLRWLEQIVKTLDLNIGIA